MNFHITVHITFHQNNVLFNLKIAHNEVPQTDHTVQYQLLRLPKLRRKRIISIENDERTTWQERDCNFNSLQLHNGETTGQRQLPSLKYLHNLNHLADGRRTAHISQKQKRKSILAHQKLEMQQKEKKNKFNIQILFLLLIRRLHESGNVNVSVGIT